jgi:2,3-bisphosphoglycerate-dependent phosphoglycerate mutase
MPRLIAALLRHGEYAQRAHTPSAHQPYPLTPRGENQARAAADQLLQNASGEGWHICPELDCSAMLRGWQTARLMADQLAMRSGEPHYLQQFDALAERCVGSVANLTVDEIEVLLAGDPRFELPPPNWKADSHYRLPFQGAESLLQAGERVAAHLRLRIEDLAGAVGRDTVKVFVGHGAAFRHAAFHLGVIGFTRIAQISMFHAQAVYIERLDDGTWRQVGGEWKIRRKSEAGLD